MICTTVRQGMECPLMTAKGCSYNGGICCETIEPCSGCKRTVEYSSSWYCTACPDPKMKWKNGNCNLATNIIQAAKGAAAKINPIKASKRSSKR
ncbi:MAG: hypothetical protein FP816_14995 [Desulfobacteraceae bacterium]|nr:hypothetical protein [Desulfobacteraceae bacterium]MBU4002726.1 PxxKW family cysteine-rich protein [Pseudomonadota bacterium]MBU4054257.1 PxxKW family cysteine-rich protein [Pseudomonadota bacterium]